MILQKQISQIWGFFFLKFIWGEKMAAVRCEKEAVNIEDLPWTQGAGGKHSRGGIFGYIYGDDRLHLWSELAAE